jgi:lipopolysaccharide/colanic/teichoic acid biosynthesis glycosyltransferase
LKVEGFVDDDPQKLGDVIKGLPVLGNSYQLQELVAQYKVDLVVVAITHEKSQQLINTLTRVSWTGIEVADMPHLYEYLAGRLPIDHLSDVWLLFNGLNKNKLYFRHLKRMMDLLVAGVLLVTHSPLFLLIALAIKWDDQGPIFYRQERLGYEGHPFQLIKFRTMIPNAEANGPQWTSDDDDRITRVGRVLRKFRLDELPQLINVLKGDMSIVGPRPEREMFIQEFCELLPTYRQGRRASDPPGTVVSCGVKEKIPYYSNRLLVKPGITGWAQVMYPYASSLEQTKEKLEFDLFYVKNIGFFLDMAILLKTVRIVLFGRGT